MHYACVTHVLGLCYSCVRLGLRLCYTGVTLALRLGYTWVSLGLRLGYAWVTLSVWCQSDVSLSSLCRLSSIGQHALRMFYTCVRRCVWVTFALRLCYAWVTLGLCLGYAWVTLALCFRYSCEFNKNIKLRRQLSVCHQSDVSLSSLCRL
jgi:hypothetical protein